MIDDLKRTIIEAALNIARLQTLSYHLNDAGAIVYGDVAHNIERLQWRLKQASLDLLVATTAEINTDPPKP